MTTLTNVQNSLFVPDLGRIVNRRPTYVLTHPDTRTSEEDESRKSKEEYELPELKSEPKLERTDTINSAMTEMHFAVLPHGASLAGWTEQDKEELNDHVRHMLHSRRSKFKRGLKGFGQYIRKRQ